MPRISLEISKFISLKELKNCTLTIYLLFITNLEMSYRLHHWGGGCRFAQIRYGVIQQLRRQEGVGRWSVKCLRGLDRYSKNESKMSTFVYKG